MGNCFITFLDWKFKFEDRYVSFILSNVCHYGSHCFWTQKQHLFIRARICLRSSPFNSISRNSIHIFFNFLISFLSNKICCVTTEPAISYRRFPSCKNSMLNAVNSIFCLGRFSERKRTSIEMDKSCLKPFLAQCSFVWEIGGENNRQLDRCCPSCLWRTWVGLRFL